jgi:hypothetical protein
MKLMYSLPNILSKIKFTREASTVQRCHTVPHIGEYPVGLHSFNMLAMLRLLWPEASSALIWAILEHDVPERLTGDIPSPTKWFKIVDRDQLNIAEIAINTAVFGSDSMSKLSEDEIMWLVGLDILELYMWCRDQRMLGNKNVRAMMNRINKFMKRNAHKFAKPVLDLYWECRSSTWEMCKDLGEEE